MAVQLNPQPRLVSQQRPPLERRLEMNSLLGPPDSQGTTRFDDGFRLGEVHDYDRSHKSLCGLARHSNFAGSGWHMEWRQPGATALQQQNVDLPLSFQPRSLTFDAEHNRTALHGYHQEHQRWEVLEYQLDEHPAFLSCSKGKLVHTSDQPLAAIEYDQSGQLLAAQGQQLHRLAEGQLQPQLDCQGQIRDVVKLSDGGTAILVDSHAPGGRDIWSWEPGQSTAELRGLLPGFAELDSPDGNHSLVTRTGWDLELQTIHGRSQTEEFGVLLNPAKVAPNLPFSAGWDNHYWSQDGRFLAVTSKPIDDALLKIRDTLIWDTQSRRLYQLPGISWVEFTDQGQLVLSGMGETHRLEADQLDQVESQPWYGQNWNQPIMTKTSEGVSLTPRQGQSRLVAPLNTMTTDLNAEGSFLIGVDRQQQQATFWDLQTGLSFQSPQGSECRYDKERDQVTLVKEDGQVECINASQLKESPWYRQHLQGSLASSHSGGLIEKTPEGTLFNGLLLPYKQPAAEAAN